MGWRSGTGFVDVHCEEKGDERLGGCAPGRAAEVAWSHSRRLFTTIDSLRRRILGMQGLVAVPTYLLHQVWE